MHLKLVSLLCLLFLAAGSFGSEARAIQSDGLVGNGFHGLNPSPSRRSLLSISNAPKTDLVATVDGNIHLVELQSGKVFWSFTSGPPIYSSYQDPGEYNNDKDNLSRPDSFFIDVGDDWQLYMHGAFGKQRLNEKIGDFISKTPLIADDGGVVLGSKKTSVFLVDAKTGNLIYDYNLSDSPRAPGNYEHTVLNGSTSDKLGQSGALLKPDDLPLYITRTDYSLKSFVLNTDRVLWNLTVSDIWAASLCQDMEHSVEGSLSDSGGYQFPSKAGGRLNMPLQCQSKVDVIRFRSHDMLGPLFKLNVLPEAHQDIKALPDSEAHEHIKALPVSNKSPHWKPEADVLAEPYLKDEKLPLPASDAHLPSQVVVDNYTTHKDKTDSSHGRKIPSNLSGYLFYLGMILVVAGFPFVFKKYAELIVKPSNLSQRVTATKRKKNRKSGKSNGLAGKRDENTSSDDGSNKRPWMMLNDSIDTRADGRSIGKLFVSNQEIAKGSNGTIVLEGFYEGRLVAVKRLVKAHHDVAFKEIQNLIASDSHANIVRWYGVESDQDFVYLSLERCTCSLGDLIKMHTDACEKPSFTDDRQAEAMVNYKIRLDSVSDIMQDAKLWKDNGFPSSLLLRLMRDVVSGLVHLHDLGIVHRDLKPQNVLIIKERSLCAKLSDMGISKRLVGDMSSLGRHATGAGSSGWQAPEQLLQGRQTRAVDMFSLGCVLFYCITGGRHPFGDHLERDINIAKNRVDLFLVEHIPEAVDLFSHLLDQNAELRPKASEVLLHPLFWDSDTRLSFFRDASDRVELEDREASSNLLKDLESVAPLALGTKWDEKMEPAFIKSIGQYRRYKFDSVRDLLRVMRNKLNHYRELPAEIKEILGAVPEGFQDYFSSRFPKLLIEVYKVMYKYCKEEECFSKYFKATP